MTTPTDRVRAALEYVLENNAYIHSQISFSEVQEKLTEALATMDGMVLVPVDPTQERLDKMAKFAIAARLSSEYTWCDYMRDLYKLMTVPYVGEKK